MNWKIIQIMKQLRAAIQLYTRISILLHSFHKSGLSLADGDFLSVFCKWCDNQHQQSADQDPVDDGRKIEPDKAHNLAANGKGTTDDDSNKSGGIVLLPLGEQTVQHGNQAAAYISGGTERPDGHDIGDQNGEAKAHKTNDKNGYLRYQDLLFVGRVGDDQIFIDIDRNISGEGKDVGIGLSLINI